jgi:hypothetical protein
MGKALLSPAVEDRSSNSLARLADLLIRQLGILPVCAVLMDVSLLPPAGGYLVSGSMKPIVLSKGTP